MRMLRAPSSRCSFPPPPESAPAQLRQIRLFPFALPDRVVSKRDEAFRGEVRGEDLRFGLAFLRVARRDEDARDNGPARWAGTGCP